MRKDGVALENHGHVAVIRWQFIDFFAIQDDMTLGREFEPAMRRSVVVLPQPEEPPEALRSGPFDFDAASSTATTSPRSSLMKDPREVIQ